MPDAVAARLRCRFRGHPASWPPVTVSRASAEPVRRSASARSIRTNSLRSRGHRRNMFVRPRAATGSASILSGLRFDGLLEGRQSACDDRRRRRRDCGPKLSGSGQIGLRTVEARLGGDCRRRAFPAEQCAEAFELRAARQKLVPAEGIEPPTFGLQNLLPTGGSPYPVNHLSLIC